MACDLEKCSYASHEQLLYKMSVHGHFYKLVVKTPRHSGKDWLTAMFDDGEENGAKLPPSDSRILPFQQTNSQYITLDEPTHRLSVKQKSYPSKALSSAKSAAMCSLVSSALLSAQNPQPHQTPPAPRRGRGCLQPRSTTHKQESPQIVNVGRTVWVSKAGPGGDRCGGGGLTSMEVDDVEHGDQTGRRPNMEI